MLKKMAGRLRSSFAGERDAARHMMLSICRREGIDPGEYGLKPARDPRPDYDTVARQREEERCRHHHDWKRADQLEQIADRSEMIADEAPRPDLVRHDARLYRFEAARLRAWVIGTAPYGPNGGPGGCAPTIVGFEDIPHSEYCRSPSCPGRSEATSRDGWADAAAADEASGEAREDAVFAAIDRAARFIDEGAKGWPPSFRLKLIFWVVSTGPNPHNASKALDSIERILGIARDRYRAGLHPDPWHEAEPA